MRAVVSYNSTRGLYFTPGVRVRRFQRGRTQCICQLSVGMDFTPRWACLPRLPVPCPTRQTGRCALRRRQGTRPTAGITIRCRPGALAGRENPDNRQMHRITLKGAQRG